MANFGLKDKELEEAIKELGDVSYLTVPKTPEFYTKGSLVLIGKKLLKINNKSGLASDEYARIYGLCERIIDFWGKNIPNVIRVTISQLERAIDNKTSKEDIEDKEVINVYINLVNIFTTYLINKSKAAA